ncbi:hypothetical protein [Microbacterium sp. LKL04]|uniref:hypothetical protein n=1 Tax=Microbacterium sp. LKL04 TaxID=912630 RepID=UPI0012F88D1D|nr:hypothetical protein [Microbacterium sp. LKL04]
MSHIASFIVPVIAYLMVVAWVLDPDGTAHLAVPGILAAVAALVGGYGLVTENRESLGTDPGIHRLLGVLHLLPSAVATFVGTLAIAGGATSGAFGLAGFIADVIVGILHFALFRGPADSGTDRRRRDLERSQKAVAGMTPGERAQVSTDLQAASVCWALRWHLETADQHRSPVVFVKWGPLPIGLSVGVWLTLGVGPGWVGFFDVWRCGRWPISVRLMQRWSRWRRRCRRLVMTFRVSWTR